MCQMYLHPPLYVRQFPQEQQLPPQLQIHNHCTQRYPRRDLPEVILTRHYLHLLLDHQVFPEQMQERLLLIEETLKQSLEIFTAN